MHISLFGGAFDPPHLGHLQVITDLLLNKIADQVWLVPTGVHDFQKMMHSADDRLEMLELLISQLPINLQKQTRIESCELERPGISHTIDTLEYLSAKYPQHTFSFVIGSDNLDKFHLWHGYQRILEKYKVFVYPRANFPMKPFYQGMIALLNVKPIVVSSTEIKKRLKEELSVTDYLPNSILDFITHNKLYLSD